jgi:hypothetical protein
MSAKRKKIKAEQLQGFKYFKAIAGILESLHDAGCQRDRAGNRRLDMDEYMSLLLKSSFLGHGFPLPATAGESAC